MLRGRELAEVTKAVHGATLRQPATVLTTAIAQIRARGLSPSAPGVGSALSPFRHPRGTLPLLVERGHALPSSLTSEYGAAGPIAALSLADRRSRAIALVGPPAPRKKRSRCLLHSS
jgi:hypothetical protein